MWNRSFGVMAAGAAFVLMCAGIAYAGESNDQPDICLISLDDVHATHLRYTVEFLTQLRNERAFRVLRYTNAHITSASCCPSRASLIRSQYSRNTGIYNNMEYPEGAQNGGAVAFRERGLDQSTMATMLHDAGYTTAIVGKYMNGDRFYELDYIPPGWDEWRALREVGDPQGAYNYSLNVNGMEIPYAEAPEDYLTDVLSRHATTAIEEADPEKPLFLYLSYYAPHVPAVPAPRHENLFPLRHAPRNPAFNEEDVSDKPQWVQGLEVLPGEIDIMDELYRDAARCLRSVDEGLQTVVDQLEASGRLDNTIFILTSDNSQNYLEHRWKYKKSPYSGTVEVPLLIAGTARWLPQNATREQLVSPIDLGPTFAELAGGSYNHGVDGISLLPTFQSKHTEVRDALLMEARAYTDPPPPNQPPIPSWDAVVMRTDANFFWKYVDLYPTGEEELYDLSGDRWELDNFAGDPHYQSVLQQLKSRLNDLRGD